MHKIGPGEPDQEVDEEDHHGKAKGDTPTGVSSERKPVQWQDGASSEEEWVGNSPACPTKGGEGHRAKGTGETTWRWGKGDGILKPMIKTTVFRGVLQLRVCVCVFK